MKPSASQLTIIVMLLFCIIFPLIWGSVLLILSRYSGWSSLVNIYSATSTPDELMECSGIIGGVNYTSTLRYSVEDEGLYLKPTFFFVIGHQPLFIPWHAIDNYSNGRFLLMYKSKFNVNGTPFYLSHDIKSELQNQINQ
ncbi:MAG: hypothetical protein IPO92_19330 [Saprospiraceae bacterium]|nr:hypothetical protein [Saprospiraceae bacterium]